jgi:hypothetical protein
MDRLERKVIESLDNGEDERMMADHYHKTMMGVLVLFCFAARASCRRFFAPRSAAE